MSGKVCTKVKTNTRAIGNNPLEGEQLLLDALYGKSAPIRPKKVSPQSKPHHYKIVSISLYNEDIELLESLVKELKNRGHYKANKSQVIRHALAQLDIDRIPKER